MNLEQEYKVYHVRSGQPKAYADDETVYRIERWEHDRKYDRENKCWYTETHLAFPEESEFVDGKWHHIPSTDLMLEQIKSIFGKPFRLKSEVDFKDPDEYFSGWVEVNFLEPGVSEVRFVRPYTD